MYGRDWGNAITALPIFLPILGLLVGGGIVAGIFYFTVGFTVPTWVWVSGGSFIVGGIVFVWIGSFFE